MSQDLAHVALDSNSYLRAVIGATRLATQGTGAGLYGTIPAWTVTAGPYEIEFDVVFPTTTVGSIKVFFDSVDANNRTFFYLSATGALRFSGATTMYVDGVAAADNSVNHPLDGAVHHIKLVNTGTVNITNIYRKYDDTYHNTCAMFNLRLTDVNNPANSRFYPMDGDGSSSVITDTSTNSQHGTWYNRTSGDVKTVYPDAIKPSETFYLAIKFEITDNSMNKGFNNLWSLSTIDGTTRLSGYNPGSNKSFGVSAYNSNSKVDENFPATNRWSQEDGVHTLIYKFNPDGSGETFWSRGTLAANSVGVARDKQLALINLNGTVNGSGGMSGRCGCKIYEVAIYSALSAQDRTDIFNGATFESVGTIRQAYPINNSYAEFNGLSPLTPYGSPVFVNPVFSNTQEVTDSFVSFTDAEYAQADLGETRTATRGKTGLYCTIATWTPTSNFRISLKFIPRTAPTSGVASIIASTGDSAATFWVYQATNTNDKISVRAKRGGADIWITSTTTLVLNSVNTLTIEYVGPSLTIGLNGYYTTDSGGIDAGSVNVSCFYQRNTYGPFTDGYIFDVLLEDLITASNKRFYPLDSPYTGVAIAEDTNETPVSLLPHFNYFSTVGGSPTINGVAVNSSLDRFTSAAPITLPAGGAIRINLAVGYPTIDKAVAATFSVVGGGSATLTADVCDSASTVVTGVGTLTVKQARPASKTADATYKFVDVSNTGSATVTIQLTALTQSANNGLWSNRVAQDVTTIYPNTYKANQDWVFGIKFRIRDLGSEQYPMVFACGGILGSSMFKLHARTDGALILEVWDISLTGVKTNVGGASLANIAPGGDWASVGDLIVFGRKNGTTGFTELWCDRGNAYIGTSRAVSGYAFDGRITLNGEEDPSGAIIRKIKRLDVYWFYLYDSSDPADRLSIFQGEHPSTGDVRQGYECAGALADVLSGRAMTKATFAWFALPHTALAKRFGHGSADKLLQTQYYRIHGD